MAQLVMSEPFELYNLLNQRSCVSRLAEINYLCLIDAREPQDYKYSHVITAKSSIKGCDGAFVLPEAVEVDSLQHIWIYDSNSCSLQQPGRATECAQAFAQASLAPVHIVRGGFERFSAIYPFLRTQKIIYTITELENLLTYPVEVIAGLLYMGDQKQLMDAGVLGDLKIKAVVSVLQSDSQSMTGSQVVLNVPVDDSVDSDLFSSFEEICSFIESHILEGSRVLVVSREGRSRCSAVTMAFLMYHLTYSLEEAWKYMRTCKPSMRPNTGLLQQLSDWELNTMGTKVTDISKPYF